MRPFGPPGAGEVLGARSQAQFRGSTSYASLNAHDGIDLGRRDDLWSWLYVLAECCEGAPGGWGF